MLEVRRATESDSRDLWEWRNDPATLAASLSSGSVTWENHVNWFDETMSDVHRVIYIGEAPADLTSSVGMCRFDIHPGTHSAEVSINLNPEHRGKRLSKELLVATIEKFHSDFEAVVQLTALIKRSNVPSKKLFTSVGFSLASQANGIDSYVLRLTD